MPASWAVRHTTVCLDYEPIMKYDFVQLSVTTKSSIQQILDNAAHQYNYVMFTEDFLGQELYIVTGQPSA